MTKEEFEELYQYYAANSGTLTDYEYMRNNDNWNGIFVYDMWRMIEYVKNDPMLQAFRECAAIIEAAQQPASQR